MRFNLTQSGTSVSTVTSYAYDTASHLIATNGPAGTSDDAAFTLDALGRFASRSVAGSLESGPDGSRLATKDASTTAYLHGNVAAAVASGGTTIVVWVS